LLGHSVKLLSQAQNRQVPLTVNIVLWLDGLTLSLTDPVSLY